VLCALALGADAVLLARPVLWALACDGADGVRDCLDAVTEELAHCMGLAGCRRRRRGGTGPAAPALRAQASSPEQAEALGQQQGLRPRAGASCR
jgi:hypothetical protein